jgi:ferredoxin-like protein FixX
MVKAGWGAFWGGNFPCERPTVESGVFHEDKDSYVHKPQGDPPAVDRWGFDDTFQYKKLTSVYHSGATHEENQPAHLHVADLNVCATKCAEEFGNPCQYFCPAFVYEIERDERGKPGLKINASNCVHCKTCDIADPYGIITWVTPEGGGGPNYVGL